jgi:putative alpha-1,2-mannosidase
MIGNHAASLIADAWAKGFRTFDAVHALDAILHEATNKGPGGLANGRDGGKEYFYMGYVPYPQYREATAKTLEYCYDDWCAMQLASMCGSDFHRKVFERQILNYRNVYDMSTRFMCGRQADGQ